MARDIMLTDEQYLAGLRRIRAAIANGRKFKFVDSNTMGDKYTHCSWGACGDEPEDWPKEALIWPDRRTLNGKVSIKYRTDQQRCPFDKRSKEEHTGFGCFYHCMAWKKKMPREKALKLYDAMIAELEEP
jgi:hypothetical protein